MRPPRGIDASQDHSGGSSIERIETIRARWERVEAAASLDRAQFDSAYLIDRDIPFLLAELESSQEKVRALSEALTRYEQMRWTAFSALDSALASADEDVAQDWYAVVTKASDALYKNPLASTDDSRPQEERSHTGICIDCWRQPIGRDACPINEATCVWFKAAEPAVSIPEINKEDE